MPSILFGGSDDAERERGEFACPECAATRAYRRIRASASPEADAEVEAELVECEACLSTYRPEVLAYDASDPQRPAMAEYQRTILRVLAMMVITDGHIHGREVETVREVFRAVSGREIPPERVLDEIVEVRREPVTVARYLARAMAFLNEYGREQVLRACVLISRADQHLHRRESEMVRHLGRVMRLEQERIEEILRSVE